MDKLKTCPFTRKEKLAVNNLKIDNGNGAYITKRDADTILHYIGFLQSEVEKLNATPKNKPLTLEQLRQMDGKTCYHTFLEDKFHPGYAVIDCHLGYPMIVTKYGKLNAAYIFDQGYKIYAHKPEQEESHAEH